MTRLPIGREDGYYLASPEGVRFVPLDPARRQPTGEVIPFPQFFRATQRAVGAMIERAIDCCGHVASADDPKICGRCGIHIDSLRPDDDEDPR
ncbi:MULTISPECIES: hypothetical protein [unclassified Mesorhizobium]|uniref:hypothetical protein n=1 Tax=unclassified Mesorhizobium TaxID=325217 RepID=UPI00112621BA|nr:MULTISPECIES: hypothetical protein [unclassified Mesorhizobium]TPM06786.1 hypothetical protein FJ939_12030 [Mesorhizobium sp. B2-3-8]TPM15331.1 hypothetical protein FJ940_14075 [Mesorhizobium sp. B2-3-7]